jgi:NADH-quinone oxidoreductase subunit M
MTAYPVLTLTTFLPLAGAIAIFLMPERLAKWIALITTLVTFVVSLPLYLQFDKTSSAMQFVETAEWIPSWSIGYGMGVDGISVPFIFLSALMTILCVTVSWTAVQTRVRDYYAALLVSLTAMVGLFACLNFFLFYLFWELMIVPIFLLIGCGADPPARTRR